MTRLLPLVVTSLEIRRGGRVILGPVTTRLEGDGITVVMGPNGSGKTTLLKALHGIERRSAGRLDWATPASEAHLHQAFVFQTPTLLRRSVLDNIAYPLRLRGQTRQAARAVAAELAGRFGLGPMVGQEAALLSAGEKQKLAIARALSLAPEVLFLDEPCASLDGSSTGEIETILSAARAAGTRIVLSTHDIGQAKRLADEVWFLHGGRLVEQGPAADFFAAPQSAAGGAYLKGELLL